MFELVDSAPQSAVIKVVGVGGGGGNAPRRRHATKKKKKGRRNRDEVATRDLGAPSLCLLSLGEQRK